MRSRPGDEPDGAEVFGDDRLRLIFTCCHPALSPEARIALTLREVCGLTLQAVARAFLVHEDAMAQRFGAREEKDPRRRHPLPDPGSVDVRRAHRRSSQRHLRGFHRRLCGDSRWRAYGRGLMPRGDTVGATPRRAAARERSGVGTRRAHAAPRRPAPGARVGVGECGTARRARPDALGSVPDSRGPGTRREIAAKPGST